jgi:hypothetical protein
VDLPALVEGLRCRAYSEPELASEMSPELRRRRQGKSCFSFTRVDEGALA